LHEIDADTLKMARTLYLGGAVWSMRPESDGQTIWVLSRQHRSLLRVDATRFEVTGRLRLPADPVDFDLQASYQEGAWVGLGVVSHGEAGSVSIVDLTKGTVKGPLPVGGEAGLVRFRSDGKSVLVANRSERMLTVLDPGTGGIVVQLPLSLRPDQFCFHPDGGQLYISGEGRDAVAVVYPYFVPEVAETVLAGSRPGPMAASWTHLFVTNPAAGDVTILDIDSKKVVAVAAVGADPGYVTVTPDREYALVLNRQSGDMAVIRIAGLQPDRRKSAALFTMIPVGSKPVSAVVTPV
jgi:DNA-binding beta-propeller fold protein YncE